MGLGSGYVHCKFGRSKSDLTLDFAVGVGELRACWGLNNGLIGAYPGLRISREKAILQAILHTPQNESPSAPQIPQIAKMREK